jgi:hypothetical protein
MEIDDRLLTDKQLLEKYPSLERFRSLQDTLGFFNWHREQYNESNNKGFGKSVSELRGKLPNILLDTWIRSVEAQGEFDKQLKAYGIK